MNEFFETVLFSIGDKDFTNGQLATVVGIFLLTILAYQIVLNRLLPKYFAQEKIRIWKQDRVHRILRSLFYLFALIGIIRVLDFDHVLYAGGDSSGVFRISTLIQAIAIFQIARMLDWIFSKTLLYNYYKSREGEPETEKHESTKKEIERTTSRTVQFVIYAFSIILILKSFSLDYEFFKIGDKAFTLGSIFYAILIILIAQLIAWVMTQLILFTYYKKNKVNVGSQYAINQLMKYVLYIFAILMAMESLGIQMTIFLGGAAALLVGVGLGLQQTFNDLISGIILLFERSIEVGNVIELTGGMVGTVRRIGLRTSAVEMRENITVVVPNSKLITENVINWSHTDDKARFIVQVGVAYGTDTKLVKELLLKVARDNVYVLSSPGPGVRFTNFGDSSLDFHLIFWSRNFLVIEDIKSDLRFEINEVFLENKISIPFPQRDVWIKKD